MGSTAETYLIENSEGKRLITWKEVARHHFKQQAERCLWKTENGRCRPAGDVCCSIETCEFVQRYGV